MSAPEPNTLLISAPVGRHFAQLHRDVAALSESVALFAEAGLRRGSGVVIIATDANTALFLEQLKLKNLDTDAYARTGHLKLLNAGVVLSQFMKGGMPEWTEFKRTIGPVLESAHVVGQGAPRAYGEMVNVLWQSGQHAAAIRLEEYWNDLAKLYPFSLFCGYMLDGLDEHSYSGPLQDIGRTHSCVIGTPDDEAFRVALETACKDIFGVSLPQLVMLSNRDDLPGEQNLPVVQRTMLWIVKNMPTSSAAVLERARLHYRKAV
jgi:hypothetical protein